MNYRKRCLIVTINENVEGADHTFLRELRKMVISQIIEGVLVVPPWITATVTDLDVVDVKEGDQE